MDLETNTSITTPRKITDVLELPDEILKEICANLVQSDLICVSLVCRRFRDFAAAQLYRNFHIVFPDEDDPFFDSPIDGLAGGLSTFATSDYNYAQYLREISLDTLSVGDRAEAAYKPYLTTVSCGKFLNTLLLLTLRKAQSLDAFRWNIRVELSRPVYKQLHEIKTLRHLHLRLQAGPSLYEPPPPLPYTTSQFMEFALASPSAQWGNPTNTLPALYGPPPTLTPPSPVFKPSWKNRASKKSPPILEPPTISGFRALESLSVLDIDSLDVITEIQACVRNSSSTLRKLKLSFSTSLAMQARKPSAEAEIDESEDDEFQVVPLVTANYDSSGPAKAFRAQEERKAQESVLGRIFELEHLHPKNSSTVAENKKEEEVQEQTSLSREGDRFIDRVSKVFQRIAEHVNGTSEFTYPQQADALETITIAATKYVEWTEMKDKVNAPTQDHTANDKPGLSSNDAGELPSPNDGVKDRTCKADDTSYDVNPDDIDVTVPEEQLGIELQPVNDVAATDVAQSKEIGNTIDEMQRMAKSSIPESTDTSECLTSTTDKQKKLPPNSINGQLVSTADQKEKPSYDASQYARDTRGISLQSLSIHLIPIKASILGKAIDLRTLTRVTLLNVGEQRRFWVLMMKENRLKPLPLRKVFTDDVSFQFLQFVSELECVKEILMLQRSPKYKPESFALNPGTNIEQIRKFVLKKHMHSIKRLMIKNQADNSWDLNEKTVQLICRRGKALEELAVIMGMNAIHTFLQHIAGLVNLRALHLVSFRTEDTCLSVMRETRRFIVDAISHHPELKLEWLALGDDDRVVRVVRKTETPKQPKFTTKGKQPATNQVDYNVGGGPFPVAPTEWDDVSESEDDDGDEQIPMQKLELNEGYSFYDICGVRIFKKEVVSGRL
ncbi:uncharacterized protein GGS22DRAFT_9238 [Annulohypoxylon maeteangense]|uniref:uncharacterized protein n=1 Tax=Annulohypoxylon maeteangense TaxID=1927788 RepID=UPI0020076CE3|nr:uncharacterized protein GGS22DRAFT_9238 [Annulohypoxylon maeteangense]KAI0890177.1 hypothetical protein GGS22DRAFT_9238 [Annulohypoxylon maeteangense]